MISYRTSGEEKGIKPFVSGTELDRIMSRIVRGAKDDKTVTFPSTARKVSDGAFADAELRSVVLNKGLETLGESQKCGYKGVFRDTRLRKVKLPSTLRTLGENIFAMCDRLREVVFEEGSSLKEIGTQAFQYCISLRRIDPPEGLEIIW